MRVELSYSRYLHRMSKVLGILVTPLPPPSGHSPLSAPAPKQVLIKQKEIAPLVQKRSCEAQEQGEHYQPTKNESAQYQD